MNMRLSRIDFGLLVATLLMVGISIVMVYSSSFALAQSKYGGANFFLLRQAIRAALALGCFMVFINVDYHVWGKQSKIAYGAVIALLIYVMVAPTARAIHGARRWISLGFVQFQVSELALLVLVTMLATQLAQDEDGVKEGGKFLGYLVKIGIVCGLIGLEPNFSTASLVGFLGICILFVAGARISHLAALLGGVVPLAVVAAFGAGYRRHRIFAFLHTSDHRGDIGYQAYQALIGLGNGGLFGVGIGQGGQKYFYLPEPHTDFVFSILGEELGFVGAVAVLLLFAFMVYCGIKIALRAPDKMGQLMAFGFTFILAIYALIHAAVNVGLIPTTGIPLPFLSYGGMSLVFTMSSMGILLNISSQAGRAPGIQVRKPYRPLHAARKV
jgi:cell division protein FtsW